MFIRFKPQGIDETTRLDQQLLTVIYLGFYTAWGRSLYFRIVNLTFLLYNGILNI